MKIVNPPSRYGVKDLLTKDLLTSIKIPKPDPTPINIELFSPSLRDILVFVAVIQTANLVTVFGLLLYVVIHHA